MGKKNKSLEKANLFSVFLMKKSFMLNSNLCFHQTNLHNPF